VSGVHAETIRASYRALNRGDVEGALQALDRDAIWTESPELPGADRFEGRDEIERFLTGFLEQWETFHQHVTSVVSEGDRALVLIDLTAVGRESGVEVKARYAHLWTMREGLGASVDAFYDTERAVRELRRD
jgi:ketosteroid isomerase-like protein